MAANARRRGSGRNDEWFDAVLADTVVALFVLIPVTYVLLLGLRLVLFATGLVHYADQDHFLIVGTSGVLYGSALVALLSAKGTLKKLANDGPASVDIGEHFGIGLAVRAPFALLIAGLTGMPDGRAAHIVVGLYWGAVAAGFAVLHTVLVDKRSVSRAWVFVVGMEVLLVFILIFGVLAGLSDHVVLVTTLEVVPAAAAGCALTYLVTWLGAWVARRGSSRRYWA